MHAWHYWCIGDSIARDLNSMIFKAVALVPNWSLHHLGGQSVWCFLLSIHFRPNFDGISEPACNSYSFQHVYTFLVTISLFDSWLSTLLRSNEISSHDRAVGFWVPGTRLNMLIKSVEENFGGFIRLRCNVTQ